MAQGNCDLIFIGDSITQGWEGRGKGVWAKHYAKRNAVNLGIGGDRTQHVIWRLDNGNLHRIKPKAAVIMIGTNNSGSNTSQEIADGVEVIVKQLRKKLPDTKVLLRRLSPRRQQRGQTSPSQRRPNAIFKKFADGKAVHYLDIGPKFLEKDGTLSREIMPDSYTSAKKATPSGQNPSKQS